MSSPELIKQLKENNLSLNQTETKIFVNLFFQEIAICLKKGNALQIRGFGRWYLKKIKENFNARNPSTNELIYKPERVKIRFKPSKFLNKKINE